MGLFLLISPDVQTGSKNHVAGLSGSRMMDRPSRGWAVVMEGGGG